LLYRPAACDPPGAQTAAPAAGLMHWYSMKVTVLNHRLMPAAYPLLTSSVTSGAVVSIWIVHPRCKRVVTSMSATNVLPHSLMLATVLAIVSCWAVVFTNIILSPFMVHRLALSPLQLEKHTMFAAAAVVTGLVSNWQFSA
jgi:hypothetical protein